MRAIWSGHVTFGLVSIPVGLYAAVEASERVSFRLLHRKDMAPIRYKKFCSEEDAEFPDDEIVKGYEVRKGEYAPVEKEELDEVRSELGVGQRTIDILQFVDFASLNPLLFERPYYVAPQKGGAKAYEVLRTALLDTRRAGIARFFLRTRPVLGALMPGRHVLSIEVLREADELRDPETFEIAHAKASAAEVKMARSLVDALSDTFDPTQHPTKYRQTLEKHLAKKPTFALARAAGPEAQGKVVDLMDALKRSLGETRGGRRKHGGRRRKAA